jgi:nitroimidazol reductase NimA-like FMN-containing flavoprotein (pyridoxamine 5'-phosphate oxidase superfamily)
MSSQNSTATFPVDLMTQAGPAAAEHAGVGPRLSGTERTRHRRLRTLGRTDRETLYAVLRAGLVAHLGVIINGWPMVVPTCYGFTPDTLYLHGSVASQSLNTADTTVCVTVTLTDALVLARSVFEHTINYRSAMIYGQPRLVTDPAERLAGLRTITVHMAPGQWDYARQPNRKELAAVRLLALPLDEASVKIRTGPPSDADSPDAALGLWAGELPLAVTWQQPVPDPALPLRIAVPRHIRSRVGTRADQQATLQNLRTADPPTLPGPHDQLSLTAIAARTPRGDRHEG